MKLSPVGIMIITVGVLAGIILWVVGYIALPNVETHRNLSLNKPILSSVNQTASPSGNTTSGATGQTAAPWYSIGSDGKTLVLNVTAASSTDNNGFNFNGYSKGALKVTVPAGWKVTVNFNNKDAQIPHSFGVVAYADKEANAPVAAAFSGSETPKFEAGITAADGKQTITFTADKAGQYAMICGVPSHDVAGMWDEFDVSSSAKAPTIVTPAGTVTVSK